MEQTLLYDARFAGARAVANTNGAKVVTGWFDYATSYNCQKDDYAYCTGYYYESGWMCYMQTTDGYFLEVDLNNSKWNFTADAVKPKTYTETQAQYLVNKIMRNNYKILCNNLLCARFAERLSSTEKQQIRDLQNRLIARNDALVSEGLVKDIETAQPAGYAELSASLDKIMSSGQIGIASWVVIVIACVIVAGMGTAAYFAYKYFADESEQDVKFSQELTRTLTSKLTEEEYQPLLDETKGIVTKARIKQALGSYWSVVKIAAFAVAGYFGYKFIKNKTKK